MFYTVAQTHRNVSLYTNIKSKINFTLKYIQNSKYKISLKNLKWKSERESAKFKNIRRSYITKTYVIRNTSHHIVNVIINWLNH
jgi:cellobiose phosphorylase